MKEKNKIRMLFNASPGQAAALQKLSRKTGAPMTEIMRRAVDAYIRSQERENKTSIGKGGNISSK